MEIITIIILITFQTTYKPILKKGLKIFWKKLKVFAAFVFLRVDDQSKSLAEDQGLIKKLNEVCLKVTAQLYLYYVNLKCVQQIA
jgi:hypothetical protein